MTILVVGAAGKFAGLVVPALTRRGERIRGFAHKQEDAERVGSQGAAEITVGDLRDRPSLDAALRGAEAVFYVAPAFLRDEAAVGKGVVDAALRADVRRFVFSSVIHPVLSGLVNHAAKIPVEEAALNSNLEYTFLHPTLQFSELCPALAPDRRNRCARRAMVGGNAVLPSRLSRPAEVAAIALTENRLLYGTSGTANRKDVAALIGDVLGRKIEARQVEPGGDTPKPLRAMFDHYNHHGLLGSPVTLRAILGREPRTLHAYFEELATER
jgi:uncharacterized protein YbjT (DUF2867 family)